jgi:hypothetical protein
MTFVYRGYTGRKIYIRNLIEAIYATDYLSYAKFLSTSVELSDSLYAT